VGRFVRILSMAQLKALAEAAPAQEFKQAKLRLILSTASCIWVLGYLANSGAPSDAVLAAMIVAATYMFFAVSLMGHILLSPRD